MSLTMAADPGEPLPFPLLDLDGSFDGLYPINVDLKTNLN
jgi:hypothetical protein